MTENQQETATSTNAIVFEATLKTVKKGDKAPEVTLTLSGSKATHNAARLMEITPGQVFITLEPAQQAIPTDEPPSVSDGQITLDESGVVEDVTWDTPPTEPCPYLDDHGQNCSFEDGMDIPPTGTTRCPECPAFGDPQGAETPKADDAGEDTPEEESASESDPGEPEGAKADEVPFDDSDAETEPQDERRPIEPQEVDELLAKLAPLDNTQHAVGAYGGLTYALRKLDNSAKCMVRITIEGAVDDDDAIGATLNLIRPLPATSLVIEADRRNFKVPLAMWLAKRDEGEPML